MKNQKGNVGLVALLVSIALIVGLTLAGPFLREYFGTRYANADREIFEKSKPFIHGSIENLNRLRLEYSLAETQAHRDAIRVMVVSQTAALDLDKIPYELKAWIQSL